MINEEEQIKDDMILEERALEAAKDFGLEVDKPYLVEIEGQHERAMIFREPDRLYHEKENGEGYTKIPVLSFLEYSPEFAVFNEDFMTHRFPIDSIEMIGEEKIKINSHDYNFGTSGLLIHSMGETARDKYLEIFREAGYHIEEGESK